MRSMQEMNERLPTMRSARCGLHSSLRASDDGLSFVLRPIASGDSLPASLLPFSLPLDGSIRLDRFGPYVREHVWYGAAVVEKTGGH